MHVHCTRTPQAAPESVVSGAAALDVRGGSRNLWALRISAVRVRLHYFVQAEGGPLEEFSCAVDAERAGEAYAQRGVPAVAYMMMGGPEEGWEEPELLAAHGLGRVA